jgi:hypothetical protein
MSCSGPIWLWMYNGGIVVVVSERMLRVVDGPVKVQEQGPAPRKIGRRLHKADGSEVRPHEGLCSRSSGRRPIPRHQSLSRAR